MKKKVLFCAYDLNIGGIENALITLLNSFDYDRYDVTLILEKKEGILYDNLTDKVKVLEYRVSDSRIVVIRKLYNFLKRFVWVIKNYHKYDFACCYATYSMPNNVLAYYASSNNCLYVHSNYKYIYDEVNLRHFFDIRRINKFKSVVFVSNEARDDLISFYPMIRDNSYVINNLIDYRKILVLSKEKVNFQKKYERNFAFIGRLEERSKRLSRMIAVFKEMPSVGLYIIGDGEDVNVYKKMIEGYDNIYLLGVKKNPYPYMKMADYVILTSDYEGFPVVYGEAIVLGKKIISTIDVSDDFISIPGRFGYIVSKDVMVMREEISRIIDDDFEMEQVDFEKLNREKLMKIEKLIEGDVGA